MAIDSFWDAVTTREAEFHKFWMAWDSLWSSDEQSLTLFSSLNEDATIRRGLVSMGSILAVMNSLALRLNSDVSDFYTAFDVKPPIVYDSQPKEIPVTLSAGGRVCLSSCNQGRCEPFLTREELLGHAGIVPLGRLRQGWLGGVVELRGGRGIQRQCSPTKVFFKKKKSKASPTRGTVRAPRCPMLWI